MFGKSKHTITTCKLSSCLLPCIITTRGRIRRLPDSSYGSRSNTCVRVYLFVHVFLVSINCRCILFLCNLTYSELPQCITCRNILASLFSVSHLCRATTLCCGKSCCARRISFAARFFNQAIKIFKMKNVR